MRLFLLNGISQVFMRNRQFPGNLVKFEEPGGLTADYILNVPVQKTEILLGYFGAPFGFFILCIAHGLIFRWETSHYIIYI